MAVIDLAKQVGTTKGDLYVHNGTTLVRLGVGADDQVLTADAAQSAGVRWGAGGGGGGGAELGSHLAGIDSRVAFAAEFGADEGYDEEFDGNGIADNTLPSGGSGTWSWVNQGAAVYRQGFGRGSAEVSSGASGIHAVMETFPGDNAAWVADAAMFGMRASASIYSWLFCLYSSVSGRFVNLQQFIQSSGNPQYYVNVYTDPNTYSSTPAGPTSFYPYPGSSARSYARIVKNSQTDYDFLISPDGACYFTQAAATNVYLLLNSQEPTHIGMAIMGTQAGHSGMEWLRIRGVT